MQNSPVVITAMAVQSCLASDLDTFWSRLRAGESGIRPIRGFDPGDMPCKVAGEVDLDVRSVLTTTESRRTSRAHHLLIGALAQVLDKRTLSGDVGIVVGSGGAGLSSLSVAFEERTAEFASIGWRALDRLAAMRILPSMLAAYAAQRWSFTGPCLSVNTACASSTDAIGLAAQLVSSRIVDTAVAAGVEAWITPYSLGLFCKLQALSTRPPEQAALASRPFDSTRDGMVPSEGAGVLVLERLDDAMRAGREPLAKVSGWASTCDAHHPVMPRADGSVAAEAIRKALAMARLLPQEIEHISAHGTSTRLNDVAETRALRLALGDAAHKIPVCAPKSMLGHASGACGVIETVATVLTMRHGFVPPTINLERADPECDLDYTPRIGRSVAVRTALKCNFGFGGQNAVLVLEDPFTARS
jgi:3-oxoacyl-[acyl-carrier-protein] synthase II